MEINSNGFIWISKINFAFRGYTAILIFIYVIHEFENYIFHIRTYARFVKDFTSKIIIIS